MEGPIFSPEPATGGAIVLLQMVKEDYSEIYWPKLQKAICQLLSYPPGEYPAISFEEMYSCVYKCVCRQLAEQLYSDLFGYISEHLKGVSNKLQFVEQFKYIESFNSAINLYLQAVGLIVKIFTYMDRFYVETKLKTSLRTELLLQFNTLVMQPHLRRLLSELEQAEARPFSVSPAVMASIVRCLYSIQPGLANESPVVFSKFIPNVLPSMNEADLPNYIAETIEIQQQLVTQGFTRGDQSRKRPGDEIIHGAPIFNTGDNHNSIGPMEL